jgi:chaperonin GroEL
LNSSLIFGSEARKKILAGAEKAAMAVVSTLGPAGRNVAIRRPPMTKDGKPFHVPPLITKDGVTVANSIQSFSDPWEDIGLQIVKDAARNTNKTGDGTTTATLLAYEMIKGGMDLLDKGANAIHVKRGMDRACDAICEELKSMARPVKNIDELKSVATISSQDKEVGEVVASAVQEVGKDGAITMQMGVEPKTSYDICSGMQIPVGYASHYFARNGNASVPQPFIIVTTEKIVSIRDLSGILQRIRDQLDLQPESKGSPMRIVIFSTGVHGDCLTTLAKNTVDNQEKFQCLVLNPPHFGVRQEEVLEDIAIGTGAKLIDKTSGRSLQEMTIANLGTADSVLASSTMTTIVGAHGTERAITDRIAEIQEQYDKSEDEGEKDYLNSRIAGLKGKIANIHVGGTSQMEQREKMHRVEDAIAATKAAHETGILPGGGAAFLRCLRDTDAKGNERDGFYVVMNSLAKQIWWIAKNAGEDPESVIARTKGDEGFNAETHQYGNMFDMNIIDPAKVPIMALRNAVAAAGICLTLEVAVDNETE